MSLIGNRDKDMKYITSLVLFLFASVSLAQGVPNTFTAGTPAIAAEVNENFIDLDTRLTAGEAIVEQLFAEIQFFTVVASAEIVVEANCPATAIVISSSCFCEGDSNTRNIGILSGCLVAPGPGSGSTLVGGGAIGGCLFESVTYNPNLPDPIVNVAAMCMEATLVDGSQAQVAVNTPGGGGLQAIGPQNTLAVDSDTFIMNAQNQASAQRAALAAEQ